MFNIIELALDEDRAFNDITTQEFLASNIYINAMLISNTSGMICGINAFIQILKIIDKNCEIILYVNEGSIIKERTKILQIRGSVKILSVERIALNILQYMSNIATLTNKFVNLVKKINPKIKIYDTRKTLPGYRNLAKYAVRCGGGVNHRMNLADMILIKDNHLKLIKNLNGKINQCRKKYNNIMIEIECENYQDVMLALNVKADIIMLDNMTLKQLENIISIIRQHSTVTYSPEIEVSGGINLDNVHHIAQFDIDRLSIGMLTNTSHYKTDFTLEVI
ncbi:MAG: carboxylating nicotinate-nucleotide diphosphorylase [Endomicrobium sp.]|jgi:nicotinate-nucleotide pyrophosphorylase (carboxylating)|nr:carboxylating nicotinate-nucleotide diphosphorylase [Endomicrobium sp.]